MTLVHRAGILLIGMLASGCATATGRFVECPLSVDQQQQAIREIVPIGTPQEQAAERLTKGGVEFTTAAGNSIYYCSTWKRPDGTRWHLNVALLFDPEHKLYQLREANSVALRDQEPSSEWTNSTSRKPTRDDATTEGTAREATAPTRQESDRIPFTRRDGRNP